jgi:hypothetical protein
MLHNDLRSRLPCLGSSSPTNNAASMLNGFSCDKLTSQTASPRQLVLLKLSSSDMEKGGSFHSWTWIAFLLYLDRHIQSRSVITAFSSTPPKRSFHVRRMWSYISRDSELESSNVLASAHCCRASCHPGCLPTVFSDATPRLKTHISRGRPECTSSWLSFPCRRLPG